MRPANINLISVTERLPRTALLPVNEVLAMCCQSQEPVQVGMRFPEDAGDVVGQQAPRKGLELPQPLG